MEFNKLFAAILVAGIIGMATGFIAESLVAPEELEQSAYFIDTGAGPAQVLQEDEVETIPSIIPLLVSADPEAGEGLTRACTACHNFEQGGPNGVGPNNWDVIGSSVGHREDFNYSNTLVSLNEAGVEWTYENMNRFLYAPRDWAPGTSMSYAGMSNAEDRANLIAWLRLQASEPVPLPTEEEAAALEGAMVEVTGTGPAEPPGEAEDEAAETEAEGDGAGEASTDEAAMESQGGDAGTAEDAAGADTEAAADDGGAEDDAATDGDDAAAEGDDGADSEAN